MGVDEGAGDTAGLLVAANDDATAADVDADDSIEDGIDDGVGERAEAVVGATPGEDEALRILALRCVTK